MRHHPKSNNGRFSKKQKKASRHMMAARHGFQPRNSGDIDVSQVGSKGMLAALGAILSLKGMRRKAS